MEGALFVLRKIKMTAANIIASLLLMGIEKILELGYRCPGSVGMRRTYILAFFLIPLFTLMLLGYYFQKHVFKMTAEDNKQRIGLFLRSSVPACIWIVILLLDGKYIECLFFKEAENCPKENSCDSTASAISKICGMFLLLAIVLGSCIYVYFSIKTTSSSDKSNDDPAMATLGPSAQSGKGGDCSDLEMMDVP